MDKNQPDLRRMKREALVDIILAQKEREVELQAQLEEAERKLNDRILRMDAAGTIAEAALDLNGVFAAAQKAADDYVASVKASQEEAVRQIEAAKEEAQQIIAEAKKEAERIRRG